MGSFDPDKIHPISTEKTKLGLKTNQAALLCYVPVLAINLIAPAVWLFSEPKGNYYLRFHAAQAATFAAAYLVSAGVLFVVAGLLGFIPVVGPILGAGLHLILAVGFFIVSAFLMYSSYNNRLVRLPVVGDFADKLIEAIDRRV